MIGFLREQENLRLCLGAIKDAIRQYGFENTIYAAKYISSKKITSIRSYFIKTLENNWADEFMALEKEKLAKTKKKEEQLTLNTMEMQIDSDKKEREQKSIEILEKKKELYEKYKQMNNREKEEIENKVSYDYMKQCKVLKVFSEKSIPVCKRESYKRIFIQERCGKR